MTAFRGQIRSPLSARRVNPSAAEFGAISELTDQASVSRSVLDAFAIWRKANVSFVMFLCPSARPRGTTRLRLDGLSWHLMFEYFSKICRHNSSLIEVEQEKRVLYMTIDTNFVSYLAQFFLEWNMFQKNLYRKSKHTFVFIFFSKILPYVR